MKLVLIPYAILTFIIPTSSLQADTIHVPADQPTIQAGIDAAVNGDTVLVADGTYTGEGNRDIDFLGKAITVRSENGPEKCIVDCEGLPYHRGFYFFRSEGSGSVLEGFTIRGGWAAGPLSSGGGILCGGASPLIRENIISDNRAAGDASDDGGGGIACFNSAAIISDNVLESNSAIPNGGGILCARNSSVTISGNTIENNVAQVGAGGGISVIESSAAIYDNIIRFNVAPNGNGDGINCAECEIDISNNLIAEQPGGAIYIYDSTGSLSSNTLLDNMWGIAFDRSWVSITGNRISGHTAGGISFNTSTPEVAGNTICNNEGFGIRFRSGSPSIRDNTISGNIGGGIVMQYADTALISGNLITGNVAQYNGGGIKCYQSTSVSLRDNIIRGNTAANNGGGVWCSGLTEVSIGEGNVISDNIASGGGGGVHLAGCAEVELTSFIVTSNQAHDGGGIKLSLANTIPVTNVLITGNRSEVYGGGVYTTMDGTFEFQNCTITANEAATGGGVYSTASVSVVNSIIWGNSGQDIVGVPSVSYSDVGGDWPGEGNIDVDPLFIAGPLGDYYLSHIDAGQAGDSPCVDAGDQTSDIIEGTTRIDHIEDVSVVDMGYHYPQEMPSHLVTAPGPAPGNPPLVRIFPPVQDADYIHQFHAYGAARFGANVTTGNVTGDGGDAILTGAGPGEIYGPHVRGFQLDGAPLPGLNFLAYGTSKYGVNVAAGDIDADGFDEVITGPGPGAVFGPHVRGWSYDNHGSTTAMTDVSYFAYGTPKWGVNVACGDIDGDGYDEIVTGAGPGSVYGPHVRGWDYDNTSIASIPAVSFMAYGTNQMGVRVSCGDVDGDGMDEIVTAPGPGTMFGAHIRGWDYDGTSVTPLPGLSFFAWEYPLVRYGATVFAGADIDGDGRDDLVVGGGPDPGIGTPVSVFRYDGVAVEQWFSLEGYEGLTHGTNVAAGRF